MCILFSSAHLVLAHRSSVQLMLQQATPSTVKPAVVLQTICFSTPLVVHVHQTRPQHGDLIVGLKVGLPERMLRTYTTECNTNMFKFTMLTVTCLDCERLLLVCRGFLGTLCHLCQHQRGVCHSGRLSGSFCGALSCRQRHTRNQDLPQWHPHQGPPHCKS